MWLGFYRSDDIPFSSQRSYSHFVALNRRL
jgi:hypothetical protein